MITLVAALALLIALSACSDTSPIPVDFTCDDCLLNLERGPTLDSSDGAIVATTAPLVGKFGESYTVTYVFGSPEVAQFDATGKLLRVYDRTGQGPGELAQTVIMMPSGQDTLLLFEEQRMHVFGPGFRFVRTNRTDVPFSATGAALRDGLIATNRTVRVDHDRTYRISLLSREGRLVRSINDAPAGTSNIYPVLAASEDGGIWSIESNEASRIIKWSPEGDTLQQISLVRPWFAARTEEDYADSQRNAKLGPMSRNIALVQVASDRLLLLSTIRDRDWTHAVEELPLNQRDRSKMYDSVLQLIDTNSGAVVGELYSREVLGLVQGAKNEVFSVHSKVDGNVVVAVWRIVTNRIAPTNGDSRT